VAVTAIGEVFNYLFDPRAGTRAALVRVFRRVHAALRPGGLFVFDVIEPGLVTGPGPVRGHAEGEGWAVLVEAREARRVLTRRITVFREVDDDVYRRTEEVHRQRLFPRADLLADLDRAGFRARTLARYGRRPLLPSRVAIAAQKPLLPARSAVAGR
jgi:SAM-dependent methyltransferase